MTTLFGRCALGASFGLILLAAGISGCSASSTTPTPQLGQIGPPVPVSLLATHQGALLVYTDYIPVQPIDLDTHQRSDYRLLRSDGTLLRTVTSAGSPAPVALPEGNYLVATSVAPYGPMKIPVHVTADQTTEICLTGEWDASFRRVPADAVVKLPDGRVVGWRSQ